MTSPVENISAIATLELFLISEYSRELKSDKYRRRERNKRQSGRTCFSASASLGITAVSPYTAIDVYGLETGDFTMEYPWSNSPAIFAGFSLPAH